MNVASLIVFAVAAVGWFALIVKVLEWRDWHADVARARQHRMGPVDWVKTNTIAALSPTVIWAVFLIGLAAIGLAAWRIPYLITTGTSLSLILAGLRQTPLEPTEIQQLRAALAQIIGVDDRQRPPKITQDGTHTAGGPLRLVIAGHPGFQYWQKTKRETVEAAIEATMPGDWETVEWLGDGTSIWERLPELPERVDYTGPIDGLDWHQIPVGINGAGQPATADLTQHPHWFVAGSTGFGKTSWLRVAAAHLLHHRIQIAAIDINYAGLAFLEGRPGVIAAMDSYEQIETTIAALRTELRDRLTQLKQSRTYRPPLVVFVDELEVLCDRARAMRPAGGPKEAQPITDLLEIARTGRKVDMYLILATQRPEGKTIPTSLRDNALGRLAVGPLGQQAARMVLDGQFARAENTPKIKGRTVLRCGDWLGWVQAYWLADPDEPKHSQADRARAGPLLPARIPDSHVTAADASETTGGESLRKRGPEDPVTSHVTTGLAAAGHVTAEDPYEHRKANDRERKRRQRAKKKEPVEVSS
jgi:hypothetical protein